MASGETNGLTGLRGHNVVGIQFYHDVLCNPDSMNSTYHRGDCHRDNQNGHREAMPGGFHSTSSLKKL